jgi:hypothetical protein
MAKPGQPVQLFGRRCVGKRAAAYNIPVQFELGGCDIIRLVLDSVAAA